MGLFPAQRAHASLKSVFTKHNFNNLFGPVIGSFKSYIAMPHFILFAPISWGTDVVHFSTGPNIGPVDIIGTNSRDV
jgi:hypothetical protein